MPHASPEARNAYSREYRRRRRLLDTEYAARVRGQMRRFHRAHPEVKRASEAVRRALRAGRLSRPEACEKCLTVGLVEAAHADYAKPLEVRWLCRPCHRAWDTAEPKVCKP